MLKRALGFNLLDVSFVLFAGFFAFICFYPMWYVFVVSITPYAEYITKDFVFAPPRSPSFLYYYSIIVGGRDIFLQTMSVSFLKTFVGSTVSVLVTAMFAYGVSKRYVMGTRTLNVLMVFTLFFSGGLIPTYILMIQLRLIDTFWVMVLPWIVNTGHFIIMRNYFSYTVPTELEDAALIDGSSEFRTFFTIVFPISKAMFAAIFLFEAVWHWNDYYSFLIFVKDTSLMPFVYLLRRVLEYSYYVMSTASGQRFVEDIGVFLPPKQLVMTTIVLAMVPVMILYPFLQRHFAKGILIGAVKE